MANDIFNYCVATNTGKGFITHDDSRRFWISGYSTGGTRTTATNSWDGSSWTEGTAVNTARHAGGGGGTQTAALYVGGNDGSTRGYTEIWNGSAWTESGDLNNARNDLDLMTTSTSLAVAFGGDPSLRRKTEEYDGSAWTNVADSSADKYASGGAGTGTLGLAAAGGASPYVATEEWTVGQNVKVITD